MYTNKIEIFRRQTDAIRRFILSCTAPFIVETPGFDPELFTGTFMTFCDRYFFITAGHVFYDRWGKDISVFTKNHPDDKYFRSIGNHRISISSDQEVDIGIVEIQDTKKISILRKNWRFLTIENVMRALHHSSKVIIGYPAVKAYDNPAKEFDPKEIIVVTELLDGDPPPEISRTEGLDFFLQYGKTAHDLDLQPVDTVDVHGTSGAAVWQYVDSSEVLWTPSRSFKIIGIQVRMAKSRSFLRALNWWAIAESLKKMDPRFEVVLARYLASTAEG